MKDNSKFGSSQSLIDSVNEVLKGGQKKLDKNNNGKIDGDDFKKLRGDDGVDEVASSMTQQRAAGAALATQRGEYDGGKKGGAINRMSAMKPSDLMKIAGTKTKELPMRKEEAEQMDELSKSTMGSYIKKARSDKRDSEMKHKVYNKLANTLQNQSPTDANDVRTKAHDEYSNAKKRGEGIKLAKKKLGEEQADEGAFSSGALKASEKFKREAKKIQSTGTYIGKDSKGVFTSKTARINGVNKEISRTYENAVMKAIKSMKAMKAKESTNC